MFNRRSVRGSLLLPAMLGGAGVFLLIGWMSSAPASLQAPGVEIGPNHIRQVGAGQVVTYHHTLTNTGATSDTFWLQARSVQGWPVELLGGDYPTGTAGVLVLSHVEPYTWTPFQVRLAVPPDVAGMTEITIITATSQLSPTVQDAAQDTTIVLWRIYLPLVLKPWAPIPHQPTLNPISNRAGIQWYIVSWTEQPYRLADTYTLQETTDASFTTGLREVCTTGRESYGVLVWQPGTYYYRVRGRNDLGYGPWSNVQATTMIVPVTPYHVQTSCWVSDPAPSQNMTVTVYGQVARGGVSIGMTGIPMEAEWHFEAGTRYCYADSSGSDGIASCSQDISGATAGYTVSIDVTMHFFGYRRCTTSFTPQD